MLSCHRVPASLPSFWSVEGSLEVEARPTIKAESILRRRFEPCRMIVHNSRRMKKGNKMKGNRFSGMQGTDRRGGAARPQSRPWRRSLMILADDSPLIAGSLSTHIDYLESEKANKKRSTCPTRGPAGPWPK